jgi:hypothetical protein
MLLFSDVKMNVGETYMCMSACKLEVEASCVRWLRACAGSEILVHFAEKIRFHTASCFATSFSHFLHRLCGTAYQVKQLVWTVMQQRL